MLDLSITKLLAVWGKASLKINPAQCLPLRSPKSSCRLCVENCPAKAIEIRQDSMQVRDDRCTGCGICANLCPTGVFEMTNLSQEVFVEKAQKSIAQDKIIKIECYKVPFSNATALSLRFPCLAHITPSLILRLLWLGAEEIIIRDAGICEVCESRCGDKIAQDTVSNIRQIMSDIGLKQRVAIAVEGISLNNLTFEYERLKDYKDEPEMSRRQIFSLFKKEAVKGVSNLIEENTLKTVKGKERLQKGMPRERGELLKMLEASIPTLGEAQCKIKINSRIFPTVTINNDCDICQLCELFCPTDALVIEDTDKGRGIIFKTASCTGCSICVDVCARKVLFLETKETSLLDIVEQKGSRIIWFDKVFCMDCGKSFVKTNAENICDTCLKEKDIF